MRQMNRHEQAAVYPRTKFKDVPRDLADLLSSLNSFHGVAIRQRDYGNLADSIAKTEPFTIILFTEPLAFEHARRKGYVETIKHRIVSELDEIVFDQFD